MEGWSWTEWGGGLGDFGPRGVAPRGVDLGKVENISKAKQTYASEIGNFGPKMGHFWPSRVKCAPR